MKNSLYKSQSGFYVNYIINCNSLAKMASGLTYCIAVILLVITAVQGRPDGATIAACGTTTDIAPDHDETPPSDTPLPYSVDLNDFTGGQYIPGETYTITLLGGTDNPDFRGFMIQGRVLADDSRAGQFTGEAGVSQPQCADDTAATHVDNSEKVSVSLTWTAPAAGTGAIRFRFAFVDTFNLFWADIATATIEEASVTDPPTAVSTDPPTTASTDPLTASTSPPTTASTDPPTTASTDPPTASTDPPTTASTGHPTTASTHPTGSTGPNHPPITTGPTNYKSPLSCGDVTGLPECNENLCSSRRNRYKQCFIVKDSCTNKCQVSRCLTCQYVRQPVKRPQRPSCVPCKTYYDRACRQRYYSCRYNYYRTKIYYYSRYYYYYYHHTANKRVFKCYTQCRHL